MPGTPYSIGLTLNYACDVDDNQTQVLDSQGGTTVSTYDNAHFLTRRTYQGQGLTMAVDFSNDKEGQVLTLTRSADLMGMYPVAKTIYVYDNTNRVTSVESKDSGNATINQFSYALDNGGQVTQVIETQNGATSTITYGYDTAGQVTNDNGTTLTYDAAGNRTGGSYGVTTGNQMSADASWTYQYDKAGNLKEKNTTTGGSSEKWTYAFSANNLMTQAKHYNSAGSLVQTLDYKYDAFGEQIEVDEDGSVLTRFGIDGWNSNMSSPLGNENMNVWARFNSGGTLTTRYQWSNAVDQQLGRIDVISGTGTAYWPLADRLNSVRDVIDSGATVRDSIAYDGFGKVTSETAPSYRGWYAWTGREYDFGLNLQYNHARWYDPKMGRWVSRDPLGFDAGDSNLYRYVNNQPTGAVDPSGLEGVGHHWIPASVLAKFRGKITKDGMDTGLGMSSGPTLDGAGRGHHYGTYGGVKHSEYNKIVERQLKLYMEKNGITAQNKMSDRQVEQFGNNMRLGRNCLGETGKGDARQLNAFNAEIMSQRRNYLRGRDDAFANATLRQLRARGEKQRGRVGCTIFALLVSLHLEEQIKILELTPTNKNFLQAIDALQKGDEGALGVAQSRLVTGMDGKSNFINDLRDALGRPSLNAVNELEEKLISAFKRAGEQQRAFDEFYMGGGTPGDLEPFPNPVPIPPVWSVWEGLKASAEAALQSGADAMKKK